MNRFLCHEKLLVRFLSLLGMAIALFLVTWILSYAFLPEAILRGRTGSIIAGEEAASNFLMEFLKIAAFNLFAMGMIVVSNWIFKVRCYPLGYLLPFYFAVAYAITLGTNSFAIPLAERMAPTFGVLARSGIYEITAYILAAASTYGITAYRVKRFIPPDSEKIEPEPRFFQDIHWAGFIGAILLLLAANAWEAYQIVYIA